MERRTKLSTPSFRGTRTLEETLVKRRSNRSFLDRPIELAAVSQLLWAGQGVRDRSGGRTTPSAGGRYPLDLYTITAAGVSRYLPQDHGLESMGEEDLREALYSAALYQESIKLAPLVIVISGDYERAEQSHGAERAQRFTLMEAGHVAQNILLQAYAMGLAGVAFGAFDDQRVREVLGFGPQVIPLYIIALGYSRG